MNQNVHFSSDSSEWETPQDFFEKYDKKYKFTLDVCASENNAKCKKYFSIDDDGLAQDWFGICWMNPPYGTQIKKWMQKAYIASIENGTTVVCLVPARTDTAWWHDYAMKGEITFLRGRLKFSGLKTGAPFPSAIVVFAPREN